MLKQGELGFIKSMSNTEVTQSSFWSWRLGMATARNKKALAASKTIATIASVL
jgi:hypothetical protein